MHLVYETLSGGEKVVRGMHFGSGSSGRATAQTANKAGFSSGEVTTSVPDSVVPDRTQFTGDLSNPVFSPYPARPAVRTATQQFDLDIKSAWIEQEKAFGSKSDWHYREMWKSGRANLAITELPGTTGWNYDHERRSRNTWFWRLALASRAKGLGTQEALDLFATTEGVEQEVWYRAHIVDTWWPLIAEVNSVDPSFLPYTTNLATGGFAAVYPAAVAQSFAPWRLGS